MICSSVNLLFFMPIILHGDGLHKHYVGMAGRGQVNGRHVARCVAQGSQRFQCA